MNITVFDFQDYPVRFVGTSDRPEWIAKDVCHCLDILDHSSALATLEDYDKGQVTNNTPSGKQKHITVYETGLYALIFKSRKPQAKAFKRWIIEFVLPSIRKTGGYSVNSSVDPDLQNLELEVKELENKLKRYQLEKEKAKLINQLDLIENPLNLYQSRILAIVKKKGECTAKDLKNALGGVKCKLSIMEVGELALQLVTLGKLKRITTKKGVRVKRI